MAELPSGTVTFLFTDIEGSTQLLKQLRERYGDVLADHHRIIREAVEEAGGQEIDTQGDALFVAFRRARDAVAAAVAAQRALAAHEWPDGATLKVRMGIHTGEPVVGKERYVGLGVHRGARICAAAHGGQILLSNTTCDLVADELPADVQVRELGEYMLRDLDRPERLFQLDVGGLPSDFPPPKAGQGRPDALVSGRERELAERARAAIGRPVGLARRRPLAVAALVLVVAGAIAAIISLIGGSNASASGIAADSVGLIGGDNNKIRKTVDIHKSPFAVAVGESAVWITNSNDGTVSRIDPRKGSVQTIPVGNSPSGIVVGGGSVWVANHDDETVSRISPATNAVVQTIAVGNGPTAVAAGAGSIWVTNADDRTVSRIDATTGTVTHVIDADAVGRGITFGGGSVWVTDESTRTVARIDPSTNSVAGTVNVGNGPVGIASGGGAVWVANSLDGTVSRIDPTTASVTATVRIGGSPSSVAVGPNGVWVSAEFGERLVKLNADATAPRIVKSVPVHNRPKGVAVGDGGCWVAVQASGRGHSGGRLAVLIPDLDSIDPAIFTSNTDALVSGVVYDGLVAPRRTGGSEGTQFVPSLATNVPVPTDDGKTYTFRVRTGVRYSNGVPVRPADFRRAFERAVSLNPDVFSTLGIAGSAACRKARPCNLSHGIIASTHAITFRLAAPNPHFLLVAGTLPPVPPGPATTHATAAKPPVGTGPYRVEDFVPNRLLTLVRNARFHVWSPAARPNGYPDEIAIRVTPSSWRGSRKPIDAVANGRADILLGGVPSDRVAELKARYPGQLHLVPQTSTFFVYLNTKRRPFDDVRVRRALNFAVDREKIVNLHGGPELAQLTCNTVPSILPGYVRYCPYTVDPDAAGDWKAPDLARAKSLVAASGTRGARVVVYTFPFLGKEGRYVTSVLRELGYLASTKELPDLPTYFATIAKVRPQAGLAGWLGFQLPDDVFATFACGFTGNWAAFCDRRIDAQTEQLRLEEAKSSPNARRLAAEIDRELVDAAPWVPLFNPKIPDFVSKRVGNYQYNVYDYGVLLDQLWVR